ncbi:hypothetical protein PIB30_021192 [Stylosanthes scabra]|uniref:Uncharacterized protein n=1 Tax=Stylosanthes scabra TaxID=79078 RepID=A0ABU6U8N5_9FABA|nr:hypothetical protein [Stylosanthes scabra]
MRCGYDFEFCEGGSCQDAPEQLLGGSYHYSTKSLVCLQQVGVETSLIAKVKAEKEFSATLEQIEILKGERDSALAFLPLKEKVDNLDDQLSERTGEKKQSEVVEEKVGSLAALLKTCQADLGTSTEAAEYWRVEW